MMMALMNSTAWGSSAFILTWDEAAASTPRSALPGPAPDDIPPIPTWPSEPDDFTLSGFRVPLIVVSPRRRRTMS